MSKKGLSLLLLFFTYFVGINPAHSQNYELKTVVIDPGHGGKDPGAVANGVREKNVVLNVGIKAGELIKAAHPNVNVVYTRKKDVFIPLDQRANIANQNKADLFISVHANVCGAPSVRGSETFILGLHKSQENLEVAKKENSVILMEDDYNNLYEGFDPKESESYIMFELIQGQHLEQSTLLADRMQTEFSTTAKRSNRGVKQAGFLVLWKTSMPSVLVELGFMSNVNEAKYLSSEAGQYELATAIANAFTSYKNKVENKKSATTTQSAKEKKTPKTENTTQAKAPLNEGEPQKEKESQINSETKPNSNEGTKDKALTTNAPQATTEISELKGTWFAVQIMSLNQAEKENSPLFKSQKPIYHLEEGGMHKYYLAISKKKQDINQLLHTIRKDFNGAFPVAFVDGKKVSFNSITSD